MIDVIIPDWKRIPHTIRKYCSMCLYHGILKDLINFPVRYGSKTLWKFLTIFYQYRLKRWMWTCNRLTVDPLIIIKYAICYIIVWIYFNHCLLTFISNSSVFLNSFLTYYYFYLKFDLCPCVLILYSLFIFYLRT